MVAFILTDIWVQYKQIKRTTSTSIRSTYYTNNRNSIQVQGIVGLKLFRLYFNNDIYILAKTNWFNFSLMLLGQVKVTLRIWMYVAELLPISFY